MENNSKDWGCLKVLRCCDFEKDGYRAIIQISTITPYFAYGLTILILAVGLLIRLFRRKLKLALVCFCLILPCYAFSLYVQINVQWFQLEHGR